MLDRIDINILEALQSNSEISNQDLADAVALSPSPCSRRVKQLEDAGYINKSVAILDQNKLGLNLTALLLISLKTHTKEAMQKFEKKIATLPEVIECYLITGQSADYVLKIITTNMNNYQKILIDKITCIEGISGVQSSFVLNKVIDKTTLSLKHLR